jgi:hypothetical protein
MIDGLVFTCIDTFEKCFEGRMSLIDLRLFLLNTDIFDQKCEKEYTTETAQCLKTVSD